MFTTFITRINDYILSLYLHISMFYMASPDNLYVPIVECFGKDDLHNFLSLIKKVSSNENARLCVRK